MEHDLRYINSNAPFNQKYLVQVNCWLLIGKLLTTGLVVWGLGNIMKTSCARVDGDYDDKIYTFPKK